MIQKWHELFCRNMVTTNGVWCNWEFGRKLAYDVFFLAICSGADWNFYVSGFLYWTPFGSLSVLLFDWCCRLPECASDQYQAHAKRGVDCLLWLLSFQLRLSSLIYADIHYRTNQKLPILYLPVVGAGYYRLHRFDRWCKRVVWPRKRWSSILLAKESGLVFDRFSAEWF